MSDLVELASLCAAAAAPDRELDRLITEAIWPGESLQWPDMYKATTEHWQKRAVLRYTGSIDDAMTLMPPLDEMTRPIKLTLGVSESGIFFHAALDNWKWGTIKSDHRCRSYALALCAAALRARAIAVPRPNGETP